MPKIITPKIRTSRDRIFSTGECARICGLSQQTIIRCFDNGGIVGFRVPGSRFRRVPALRLKEFIEKNGVPADRFREECPDLFDEEPKAA
jgi:hypothetical protein